MPVLKPPIFVAIKGVVMRGSERIAICVSQSWACRIARILNQKMKEGGWDR